GAGGGGVVRGWVCHEGGGADGAAGVACRRGAIHFLERRPPINFSVRDRVHRATPGDREIIARILFVKHLEEGEKRLLVRSLDRARDVFVFLLDWLVRSPGRAEKIDKWLAI